MIEVCGLTKSFGDVAAVRGIDLEIARAETFGLLGPNGAGKSTTIHMLIGALQPDSGRVTVDGGDVCDPDVRRRLGVAPQELAIYPELSAEENLAFFGRIYGLSGAALAERVRWALDFAGLAPRRSDRAQTYSGGMKRRLNLACATVHAPQILVCDEPTVGVDPQSRNHIFECLEALRADGCTLLYTTHYMEEAERLCDRVAIIDRGRILAVGTVPELIAAHGGLAGVHAELGRVPEDTSELPGELVGTTLTVQTERPIEVLARLARLDLEVTSLRLQQPDLEGVFLRLTGRKLRD